MAERKAEKARKEKTLKAVEKTKPEDGLQEAPKPKKPKKKKPNLKKTTKPSGKSKKKTRSGPSEWQVYIKERIDNATPTRMIPGGAMSEMLEDIVPKSKDYSAPSETYWDEELLYDNYMVSTPKELVYFLAVAHPEILSSKKEDKQTKESEKKILKKFDYELDENLLYFTTDKITGRNKKKKSKITVVVFEPSENGKLNRLKYFFWLRSKK